MSPSLPRALQSAVVIPARTASTRLPQKLLLRETGRSVLEHTYAAAAAATRPLGVWLAAGDETIVREVHRFGGRVERTDPELPSGTDRVAALARRKEFQHFDILVNVQGDEPEIDPAVIDRYWSKQVEAWYEGGRNDPNLLMLRFDLGTAEIWLADLSLTGVFKMMFGGDVSKEMKSKHAEVAL